MPIPYEPVVRTRVLVREVMNSPVVTATSDEDMKTIALRMSQAKVGSVIVTQQDLPIGIITDGDIVSKVASVGAISSSIKASEIMSSPLRMIGSEKEIIEAAREMRKQKIKRLGVSYKQNLVGIISISDIFAITPELFDIISEKARMVTSESARQPSFLAGYCDQCNQWSDVLLEMDSRFICEECRSGARASDERQA